MCFCRLNPHVHILRDFTATRLPILTNVDVSRSACVYARLLPCLLAAGHLMRSRKSSKICGIASFK